MFPPGSPADLGQRGEAARLLRSYFSYPDCGAEVSATAMTVPVLAA